MGVWIACGILAVLAALPLGIRICYDRSGLLIRVILGPLKLTVFPWKYHFPKREKKKKETTPSEAPQAEKKVSVSAQEAQSETLQKTEQSTGGSLKRFLPLLRIGFDFLGDLRRKLQLNNLYLRLILANDDPCDLAVSYGRAWAAVGNLIPALERLFVIKRRDIQVACDFTAAETRIIAHGDITITLGRLLVLAVRYGIRVLKEFLAMKRKGGAAK